MDCLSIPSHEIKHDDVGNVSTQQDAKGHEEKTEDEFIHTFFSQRSTPERQCHENNADAMLWAEKSSIPDFLLHTEIEFE